MAGSDIDWEALRTAAQVARSGTVRGAARALGIHHTTAARRIVDLERALGSRLFDRRPEGYVVTPEGEALMRLGRRFEDDLIAARRAIDGRDSDLSGVVTVTVPEPIFAALLAPRLPEFAALYPDLELDFATGFAFLDMARHEADVAIRLANAPPETLIGKRLFAYRQTAYATPDYLQTNEPRWLGWGADGGDGWARDTEFPDAPVWGAFPTLVSQQAACAAGLGLAMLPCLFGDEDPRLARAGTRRPERSRDVWLLTHPDLRRTARVRAFMTFAEQVLRDARTRIVGDRE